MRIYLNGLATIALTIAILLVQDIPARSQHADSVTTSDDGSRSAPALVVLGNVQDGGYPHIGCRRPCCAEAWGEPSRYQCVTCLGLIDVTSRSRWIFEATPDMPQQLATLSQLADHDGGVAVALPGRTADGIFVTHAHLGHYTGLMYLGREALGARRVPVHAMPRMTQFLQNNGPWSQLVALENIELRPLRADQVVRLNERLTVKPFLVPHRDEFSETVGFLIQGPHRTAVFVPDIDKWERWDRNIDQLIQHVDYAFLDGTFFDGTELPDRDLSEIPHPLISDSLARFGRLGAEHRNKIYFIHMNHTNPTLRAESEATRRVLEVGCHIARTGDRIEL